MSSSICFAVGTNLENFAAELRYAKSRILVKFVCKRKDYGAKVYIYARYRRTKKAILGVIMKIRSCEEISALRKMLEGTTETVHAYYMQES